MRVCVVGLGYIGLPTATLVASRGAEVLGLDVKESVVQSVNKGQAHIFEPDLDGLLHKVVREKKLVASTTPEPADIFLIAVPTPFKENHAPDLSLVMGAVERIAPVICSGNLIILESTSPVGTTQEISQLVSRLRPDLTSVHYAYCPERVLPGRILEELIRNDRVVGGLTPECSLKAQAFYQMFVKGEIFVTDAPTAELVKLTENAFRDTNIAFANELSLICDHFGINVFNLIRLANRHPRVKVLQPGPGVGGHCIAVDPWFIVHAAPQLARLIRTSREVNDGMPHFYVERIRDLAKSRQTKRVACLGLAFKPNIDDLRESPAIDIAKMLASDGTLEVLAVEPHVKELPPELREHKSVRLVDLETAIASCEVIAILVDHNSFKILKGRDLSNKSVVDTRGMLTS